MGSPRRLPACKNDIDPSKHLKLVMYWAIRFGARRPIEDSEQYSIGVLGLLYAAEVYDPARGCTFATYATWWIRQYIQRSDVYIHRQKRGGWSDAAAFSQMGSDRHFDPSRSREPDPRAMVELEHEADFQLRRLDERTARILRRHFMDGLTFEEISELEGVSRARVAQITEAGLSRLRRRR